ncbi:MAG: hypothetical protein ABJM99_16855 [Parasphingorhabdus sp.]
MEKLVVPMPDIRTLAGAEARIIISLRLAIVAHKTGQDCRERLDDRLGSRKATTRLLLIVETVGFAWPEAFKIGCPCSPQTTPDEILFLNMIRYAVAGNRPAYDALLCEMIDDSARERIFHDIQNFSAIYMKG